MYLVELDTDGLIKMDRSGSGWLAIADFRAVYEKFGRKGFTVVALTKDYLTVFRNYPKQDERYKRAMDHIFESRKAMAYDHKLVVQALKTYGELQWNAELEQEQIYNQIKSRYLEGLAKANNEGDDAEVMKINKQLNQHEIAVSKFKEHFKKSEIIKDHSVTEGGYHLSRIETELKQNAKKSRFSTMGKNMEKPGEPNV